MLKQYLKQAWALLRQNPLFSTLYIVGTGLAIGMTMAVALIFYVKLAPVYPEENRGRTLYLQRAMFTSEKNSWQSGLSYKALQDWALGFENAEAISASLDAEAISSAYIQPDDRSGDFQPVVRLVDSAFFRVYTFRFLEGNPFTEADLRSGIRTAVITDDLARRLFGAVEGAVGKTFSLDYSRYRVCGVVRGGSYLTIDSYAKVYVPYSVSPDYRKIQSPDLFPYFGRFRLTFLVKDAAQERALKAEVKDVTRRLNLEHEGQWKMNLYDQPLTHVRATFLLGNTTGSGSDLNLIVGILVVALFVLLLVPALNLSGMIASRMESRLAEMGVRKSFGAGRGKLLGQVMWENLLLTLLGGLLGLVVAWVLIYMGREWIFSILSGMPIPAGANASVSGEMLFAPAVFGCALLFCVVLNMMSALVPAWLSLRKPIVNSLYERR